MIFKLSLRNAKRQAKEYSIYFATLIISIAMLYSFNNFIFSNIFQTLSKAFSDSGDNSATYITVFYSCVIVFVVAWLISYMLNFMLKKRSSEFATYMLLGIEKKQIAQIYMFENGIIGIISLLVGVIVGVLFSGFMYYLVNIFLGGKIYSQNIFSLKAAILTIVYFIMIYFIMLILSNRKFRVLKLITLLNYDRLNERPSIRKTTFGIFIFTISIILGIGSLYIFIEQPINGDYSNIVVGFIMIFLCYFGLYFGIYPLYYYFYSHNKGRKLRVNNIFLFRLFSAKINKHTILCGLVASALTIAILFISTGVSYATSVNKLLDLNGFDIAILHNGNKEELNQYDSYLSDQLNIKKIYTYNLYTSGETSFIDIRNKAFTTYLQQRNLDINPNEYLYDLNRYDMYMGVSDYNVLRKLLGYDSITLEENSFIIHCLPYLENTFTQSLNDSTLRLSNSSLSFAGVYTENFSQYDGYGNGQEFLIIVPDKYLTDMEIAYSLLVANLANADSSLVLSSLTNHFPDLHIMNLNLVEGNSEYMSKLSYGQSSDYLTGKYVIFSTKAEIPLILSLIFLGALLCIACTVIMSVQLLSDNSINGKRYSILHLLGVDKRRVKKILRKQILIYFLLPAIPTILLSIGLVYIIVNTVLNEYFMVPIFSNLAHIVNVIFGTTMLVFILIYIVYILISYLLLKKDILKNLY